MLENKNNSLKEYYIKLQGLYNNAVNMLTAINQSLTTSASEITVNIEDSNGQSTVRIPSFIYLENKLEQLNSSFNNLFNMPESGEAWFNNDNNMYKLELVKSNVSPIIPTFTTNNIFSYTRQNNLFKDLVNPKTYIKLNITNLPNNISTIYMKKIIFHTPELYETLINKNVASYNDFKNATFNLTKGVDFDEYDSEIKLPVKKDQYNAYFDIIEIPKLDSGNPYQFTDGSSKKLRYNIRLNTLKYVDIENDAILFELKVGDNLTLINSGTIYVIKQINTATNEIIIEEKIGHSALQTINQNSEMVLTLYNQKYDQYNYVELPLEENPYICIFISTVYNNIRSLYSAPLYVNLNNILMRDENGQLMYKSNSNTPMTYMEYYNKYCKNIGDLMLGFIETTYPQLSNYNKIQLNELQNSTEIQSLVSSTIDTENILKVEKINDHLVDDLTSENIINLHNEKSQINSQLNALQANIDQVYSQLVTTDFSQETSLTQESLRSKLDNYYNQRVSLQKQQISIIDNINILKGGATGIGDSKFRIRGISNISNLETYITGNYGNTCNIIGLEVEYKYKSTTSDTTNITVINSNVFTDWNRLNNIERERKLSFDNNGDYTIVFENYDTTTNIIKWNQIDIPINQGEDVVIRIRYKYSVGQPFINLYTPWSNEITMTFPTEFTEINELSTIITGNNDDIVNAKFNNTLINDGYQEHITNKIIDNSQVYYHMPENIYSGFNTPENKLISLKDKLTAISNDLEQYKSLIQNELNSEYKVYIEYDNKSIEIHNNTVNKITVIENNNGDTYNVKTMNLVIKNNGTSQIKFYSIFSGDTNTSLLRTDKEFYNKYIKDYERVPLLCGDSNELKDSMYTQKLGQWIYFRQNNPFTKYNYYDLRDVDVDYDPSEQYKIYTSNNQRLYKSPYVESVNDLVGILNKIKGTEKFNDENTTEIYNDLKNIFNNNDKSVKESDEYYLPSEQSITDNKFILCYENIIITNNGRNNIYLSNKTPLTTILETYSGKITNFNNSKDFIGGFFIPKLLTNTDLLCDNYDKNQYKILDIGKTLSIPLVFEYFTNGNNKDDNNGESIDSITKTLAFDLRSSVINDPEHYVITVESVYNKSIDNNIA